MNKNKNDQALMEIRKMFATKTVGPSQCGWSSGDPESWQEEDTDRLVELVGQIDASLSKGGPLPRAWRGGVR